MSRQHGLAPTCPRVRHGRAQCSAPPANLDACRKADLSAWNSRLAQAVPFVVVFSPTRCGEDRIGLQRDYAFPVLELIPSA